MKKNKDNKAKESKEERDARIQYSENGRKLRTHTIPNKKKDFNFDDYEWKRPSLLEGLF